MASAPDFQGDSAHVYQEDRKERRLWLISMALFPWVSYTLLYYFISAQSIVEKVTIPLPIWKSPGKYDPWSPSNSYEMGI